MELSGAEGGIKDTTVDLMVLLILVIGSLITSVCSTLFFYHIRFALVNFHINDLQRVTFKPSWDQKPMLFLSYY